MAEPVFGHILDDSMPMPIYTTGNSLQVRLFWFFLIWKWVSKLSFFVAAKFELEILLLIRLLQFPKQIRDNKVVTFEEKCKQPPKTFIFTTLFTAFFLPLSFFVLLRLPLYGNASIWMNVQVFFHPRLVFPLSYLLS